MTGQDRNYIGIRNPNVVNENNYETGDPARWPETTAYEPRQSRFVGSHLWTFLLGALAGVGVLTLVVSLMLAFKL